MEARPGGRRGSTTGRGCGPGEVITGPAIVTEMDSTTLVPPQGHAATVHASGLAADPTGGLSGIYMITVADPQILWNDGFYPLVDVEDPGRLVLEAAVPGGAERAQPRHRSRVRPLRRPAGPDQPGPAQRRRILLVPALHVLRHLRRGRPQERVVPALLHRLRRHPGRPIGDGPDGHSLWPSFVNIPCEYLESYYPLRIERWETVADTGGSGLHRGGNGVDVAYHSEVIWASGGWGDPLERDLALVALEVRRGLVTVSGARRYGVVVVDGAVDSVATDALREEMRAGRPAELPVFDMGPPIEELLARCEEETGLPAPTRPTWAAQA